MKGADPKFSTKIKFLPEYMDKDIYILENSQEYFDQILMYIKGRYIERSAQKKFRQENGFQIRDRYAFMNLLFMLLTEICNKKNYATTKMNANELAVCFKDALQSKRYLFHCKAEMLKSNGIDTGYRLRREKIKNKTYEDNFVRFVKIMIYFAKYIFPYGQNGRERVIWPLTTLIAESGNEVSYICVFILFFWIQSDYKIVCM